jgi:hypothetical protein
MTLLTHTAAVARTGDPGAAQDRMRDPTPLPTHPQRSWLQSGAGTRALAAFAGAGVLWLVVAWALAGTAA